MMLGIGLQWSGMRSALVLRVNWWGLCRRNIKLCICAN